MRYDLDSTIAVLWRALVGGGGAGTLTHAVTAQDVSGAITLAMTAIGAILGIVSGIKSLHRRYTDSVRAAAIKEREALELAARAESDRLEMARLVKMHDDTLKMLVDDQKAQTKMLISLTETCSTPKVQT